jgi:hypothetical protein
MGKPERVTTVCQAPGNYDIAIFALRLYRPVGAPVDFEHKRSQVLRTEVGERHPMPVEGHDNPRAVEGEFERSAVLIREQMRGAGAPKRVRIPLPDAPDARLVSGGNRLPGGPGKTHPSVHSAAGHDRGNATNPVHPVHAPPDRVLRRGTAASPPSEIWTTMIKRLTSFLLLGACLRAEDTHRARNR